MCDSRFRSRRVNASTQKKLCRPVERASIGMEEDFLTAHMESKSRFHKRKNPHDKSDFN